jgi:2'-5' RNA ligase
MAVNGGGELIQLYDALWAGAEAAFAAGNVRTDPHLDNKAADDRRGLSLILRPDPAVVREATTPVDELKRLEPDQYYYRPTEYHVTVLSLLTCSAGYQRSGEEIERYDRALSAAVAGLSAFRILFQGITGTPEAVMIQGFPEEEALNRLRSRIMEKLKGEKLSVQQRYAPKGAHITVMRYRRQSADFPALAAKLRSLRRRAFGTARVAALQLVENDWYMSSDKLTLIKEYELATR